MSFAIKTDQELVHLYIEGNETALAELITRHKSRIYTSIYLLVKDEYLAEDIFQDTFIKVIKTLKPANIMKKANFCLGC